MLNVYRRHNQCSQNRKTGTLSRKPQEAPSKKWKRCDCWLYASGTLADGFNRKNTGQTTWPEAEAQAKLWEKAGLWAAPTVPLVTTTEVATDPQSVAIADEMAAFLQEIETTRYPALKPPTIRKHKTFNKQFLAFCDSKGYGKMTQLKAGDVKLFYHGWKDDIRARANKLAKFRKLGEFLLDRKSITPELAKEIAKIPMPAGYSKGGDRVPFTDEELERLYRACDNLGTVGNQVHSYYTGEDLKDFIILDTFTGLRISDVATFDTQHRLLGDNRIFLRMKKTGESLTTWVPDWVQERLNGRQRKYGTKLFKMGESERLESVTDNWRKRLNKVFDLAQEDGNGAFKQKPTPHRFRYTFVRILLENGLSVPDVAELAGDTEAVIIKYYKQWVPSLQEKLIKNLKEAFGRKPNLVAIKGGKSA